MLETVYSCSLSDQGRLYNVSRFFSYEIARHVISFSDTPSHKLHLRSNLIFRTYTIVLPWQIICSLSWIKVYELKSHLSQYLTNLMHKICFTISFISCLYMFRANVLIIRRSKLYYTASGIIIPIGGSLVQETTTYRCDDTTGCAMQFWPPDDEKMCSKHVEAWNETYCETSFVHQVG